MSVISYHVPGRDQAAKQAKDEQNKLHDAASFIRRAARQYEADHSELTLIEWVAVLHAIQENLLADALLFGGDTPTE
jgi:hypothetical protein